MPNFDLMKIMAHAVPAFEDRRGRILRDDAGRAARLNKDLIPAK